MYSNTNVIFTPSLLYLSESGSSQPKFPPSTISFSKNASALLPLIIIIIII